MKKIFLIIISSILFLSGCSYSKENIDEYKEQISELESKIKDLELDIKYLKDDLDHCKTEKEEYQEYYYNNCEVNDYQVPEFSDY